jgi:UDP:flavonoid glycosyltransferase YjiC (YdhE family)
MQTLDRRARSILVLFHGADPTHANHAYAIARQLHKRGYTVRLAARGPHAQQPKESSIKLCDVETLPLAIHSEATALSDYRSCDPAWIEHCVESERSLIRQYRPDLIIHSMKPTASIAAHLEGVDEAEIIRGYQLPWHSQPSPGLSAPAARDQFAVYLKSKCRSLKKRDKYYLVADTSELYPMPDFGAGSFHYIGPLLQTADKKATRKRASLPTIYLKDPEGVLRVDLLQQAAAKEKTHHLLVESSNTSRAQPQSKMQFLDDSSSNIPWQKIDVIIGGLDLKTLCEALAHGVFPVGLARTLEQELLLDRLSELNIALKIDLETLNYTALIQALDALCNSLDKKRAQVQLFADHLRSWSAQDLVADWVDNYFTSQRTALRYDPQFLLSEREFLNRLTVAAPPTIPTASLRGLLRAGVTKGMPHWRQGKELFFDKIDSWNWLYERGPRFFAADYWACDQRRRAFFAIDETGSIRPQTGPLRYRVSYTCAVRMQSDTPKSPLKAFIPYPLETQQQRVIRLVECSPKSMESYLYGSIGFFYAYPCNEQLDALSFSYICEVEVDHQHNADQVNHGGYTEIGDIASQVPELEQLLKKVDDAHAPTNKKALARAFYRQLVQTKKFRKTKVPAAGFAASAAFLLNNDGGNCIHFAQTFIALCRMVGIPAREKCGALLGYPTGEKIYESRSIDEPLIGHTWAEIYLEGEGWIPVDFHSTAIGAAALTEDNITDPGLRQYIHRNTAAFNDFYFGHIDNQRLLYSNSAKTIPLCAIENEGRWQGIADAQYTYHIKVECI